MKLQSDETHSTAHVRKLTNERVVELFAHLPRAMTWQSHLTNDLPLLKLPEPVKQLAVTKKLSKSKAEALGELHRKARTSHDKRRAMMRLMENTEWQSWNDREISQHCGVSREFVRKLRKAIFQPLEDRHTRKARRGGTTYEMDTTHIGQRADDGYINATAMC
jgi:hypothetical protein